MPPERLNILQVIHDFLPTHRAGSEIYAASLAEGLADRHHVTVLCAEYDPSRTHGQVGWRVHNGVPVVEVVNNWIGRSFEDTYRPALITERVAQVLDAVQPDVVHVHNLFNLSFELPALARARGIPVVATLHDYTLVCPSGGQRLHRAESHVCDTIDPSRCARCFKESPFYTQLSVGLLASVAPGGWTRRLAATAARRFPQLTRRAAETARLATVVPITAESIVRRLESARQVFKDIELFVAPSRSMADEFVRLGIDQARVQVSANGQAAMAPISVQRPRRPLRIGFVGTIVWHKGVHVLLDAVRDLPSGGYEVRIFGSLKVAPDYVTDLRARSAGLPVRFAGVFEPSGVAEVFADIDVLVVPSLWPENAPLVIQEAFQAGVAVVGSRIGGIPEFVSHGRTGYLFEPGKSQELSAVLRELIDHPSRLTELAANRPPIKAIADDVRDWEGRYRQVVKRLGALGQAS